MYRFLLHAYPADFRARFEGEMLSAYEESSGGWREIAGLIAGIPKEWIAKWTTPTAVRARWFADWRLMRPAGLAREEYFGPEPADLIDARRRVDFCMNQMKAAVANQKFDQARFYFSEDVKARGHLRRVREKYGQC